MISVSKDRRMIELKRGMTNYKTREEGPRTRCEVKEQEEKGKRCETKSNRLSFPPSSVHLRTTFRLISWWFNSDLITTLFMYFKSSPAAHQIQSPFLQCSMVLPDLASSYHLTTHPFLYSSTCTTRPPLKQQTCLILLLESFCSTHYTSLQLSDLASKNTGCPVKLGFQIKNNFFNIISQAKSVFN